MSLININYYLHFYYFAVSVHCMSSMGKFLGPISGKTLCWIYEPTAREIFERCRIL